MSAGSPSRVVASSSSMERVLVGALAACDTALDEELAADVQSSCPRSVVETWDEARDERDGLLFSIAALAIWIYGTCRDRDALLLPTVATRLLEALWASRWRSDET